jgi:hypothetical protein
MVAEQYHSGHTLQQDQDDAWEARYALTPVIQRDVGSLSRPDLRHRPEDTRLSVQNQAKGGLLMQVEIPQRRVVSEFQISIAATKRTQHSWMPRNKSASTWL